VKKDKNTAALLIEDLKNGIKEEIKQKIYERYTQCARWDNASFDAKETRFDLADFDNEFALDTIRYYGISYEEYLRFYCEVRNDGLFYPDEIDDVDAFVNEKLSKRELSS